MDFAKLEPSHQIRDSLIEFTRAVAFSYPLPTSQIRAALDVSGTPKDIAGISISCQDMGDHKGYENMGRKIIDVSPSMKIYTHIDEDNDGSICESIIHDVSAALRTITFSLSGWKVANVANWTISDTIADGTFRIIEISSSIILVKQ